MLEIECSDKNLITQQVKNGQVVLVLGASANFGSENRNKCPIKFGDSLAGALADDMGEAYEGEGLSTVVSAYKEMRGDQPLKSLLTKEFRFCGASKDLHKLFQYTWSKVYTWNIDDALDDATQKSVQRCSYYNGISDKVEQIPQYENLQIIYLHGSVKNLDKGIIFSEEEYAKSLQAGNHYWYKELSTDYIRSPMIFIGSSMKEPILAAEVQRASEVFGGSSGRSYIVTPDILSNIQKNALKQRGLVHIRGTIGDFVHFLEDNVGDNFYPESILSKNGYTNISDKSFSHDEVESAHSIFPRKAQEIRAKFLALSESSQQRAAREFLNGFSPTWEIAGSDIPVKLHLFSNLRDSIFAATKTGSAMYVVYGQAGSGKTTSTMMALLEIGRTTEVEIYEVSDDIKSLRSAMGFLGRLSDKPKIVFINNISVFGQLIVDDFDHARRANVMLVTTVRSSEWGDRFERYLSDYADTFHFSRFDTSDHDGLLDRLRRFVPAPSFIKLSDAKQRERLARSKSQLLIALREATESRNFDEIIFDEFNNLPDDDCKDLFIIAGLGTLAKVGVEKSAVVSIYESSERNRKIDESLAALSGIVRINADGRLLARHDLYVKHILDRGVTASKLFDTIIKCLDYFTRYQIPITKNVSRSDAVLFRFLLNYNFVNEWAKIYSANDEALAVYKHFEVEFQLDGHFWLQYGLFVRALGKTDEATRFLEKSIEAFPGNPFAIHALAHSQLIEASKRLDYDHETKRLIKVGVSALEGLVANPMLRIDQYPLVTLADFHIDALINHRLGEVAKIKAREYFEELKKFEKSVSSKEIERSKVRLMRFIALNVWSPVGY